MAVLCCTVTLTCPDLFPLCTTSYQFPSHLLHNYSLVIGELWKRLIISHYGIPPLPLGNLIVHVIHSLHPVGGNMTEVATSGHMVCSCSSPCVYGHTLDKVNTRWNLWKKMKMEPKLYIKWMITGSTQCVHAKTIDNQVTDIGFYLFVVWLI